MFWSILVFRQYHLSLRTLVAFVDLAHFFDTILVENVLVRMSDLDMNTCLLETAQILNTNNRATVITAAGHSKETVIDTGLRQGGRFSTTGAKLGLQQLNKEVRTEVGVFVAPHKPNVQDIEFADDEIVQFVEYFNEDDAIVAPAIIPPVNNTCEPVTCPLCLALNSLLVPAVNA